MMYSTDSSDFQYIGVNFDTGSDFFSLNDAGCFSFSTSGFIENISNDHIS